MTQGNTLPGFKAQVPPRPSYYDDAITERLARLALERLAKIGCSVDPEEEVLQELVQSIEFNDDAYDVARALDDAGWNVSAEIVDELDYVLSKRYDYHKDAVREWVKTYGINLTKNVGDEVKFKHYTKTVSGKIIERHDDTAMYLIRSAELGHVDPSEQSSKAVRILGTYITEEDIENE